MPRAITITLTDVGRGYFEVKRNRIPLLAGPVDMQFARDYINRIRNPDELVILIEVDGYEQDITNEFVRRPKNYVHI